ncbi:MAG: hypothetical protein LW808_000315 [Verrucomicrobiota bacterium]|nr:MAG: hypothetical protein LW808_000315 [Verrucomicrobiota bacterium]
MNSIGNSIRNFFSTTIRIDKHIDGDADFNNMALLARGEFRAKGEYITARKEDIREALKLIGFGFWDRMKAMRAIGCANDMGKVRGLDGDLGQAVQFIHKKISDRKTVCFGGRFFLDNGKDSFLKMIKNPKELQRKFDKFKTENSNKVKSQVGSKSPEAAKEKPQYYGSSEFNNEQGITLNELFSESGSKSPETTKEKPQ